MKQIRGLQNKIIGPDGEVLKNLNGKAELPSSINFCKIESGTAAFHAFEVFG